MVGEQICENLPQNAENLQSVVDLCKNTFDFGFWGLLVVSS